MTIKKIELYSSFWVCCEEPCGAMDFNHNKDYALVMVFMDELLTGKTRLAKGGNA